MNKNQKVFSKKAIALPTLGKFIILLFLIVVFIFVIIKGGLIETSQKFPGFEKKCPETGLTLDDHSQNIYIQITNKDYSKAAEEIDAAKICFKEEKFTFPPEIEEKISEARKKV